MIWPFNKAPPEIKEVIKIVKVRDFNSAKMDRLTNSYNSAMAGINEDIKSSLKRLRGRSRDSAQNSDYYIRALSLFANYVVGPQGQTLVSKVKDDNKKPDKEASDKIEEGWRDFGKKEYFSLTNEETFYSFQWYSGLTFARDGEVFIHPIEGFDNKFGLTFQIIDADYLDENYNDTLANGNIIRSGIEFTKYGKRVAYHFEDYEQSPSPTGIITKTGKKKIFPANQIIHHFNKVEINQIRGFPVFQNILLALHGLSELNESEMMNYRVGSCKMGFIEQEHPGENIMNGLGDELTDDGQNIEELEPGLVAKLRRGEKFVAYSPDHKSADWERFSRGILRSVSSGSGLPYPLISNDYSGLDSDAFRLLIIDAREFAMSKQKLFADNVFTPMFNLYLKWALMKGAIQLPIGKIEKFSVHEFRGRPFQSIRPLEDMQANQIAIEIALNSRTNINKNLNIDQEDIFEQLGNEEIMAVDKNVPLRNQGGTTEHNINADGMKNEKN